MRFSEFADAHPIKLPCGTCVGCKLVRVHGWAIRCLHEAQMHKAPSSFVTLTYDDDHLYSPSLNYSDFQRFMRRVRAKLGPTRFFVAGEYGEETHRPHFHALLFGLPFSGGTSCGKDIYSHPTLTSLWEHGFSSCGAVTFQSAAYVASYSLKKLAARGDSPSYASLDLHTGELARLVPPFCRMSLRPGIGYSWFQKYWEEVYVSRDGVVRPGGHMYKAPRYYDKLLEVTAPDLREYKDFQRYVMSARYIEDSSPQRLLSREVCALAAQKMKGRGL